MTADDQSGDGTEYFEHAEEAPHGPGAGHAATLGCRCGYRVRARNADKLRDHKAGCPRADREPRDGESYGANGHIRPVPPGVENTPEGDS